MSKSIWVTAAPGLVVSRKESSTRYITDQDVVEVQQSDTYYHRLIRHGELKVLAEDEAKKLLMAKADAEAKAQKPAAQEGGK